MIESSNAYKIAVVEDTRRVLLRAIIDIIDPDVVYGTTESQSEAAFSQAEQLHDKVFELGLPYTTLELNRWILDGVFRVFPDDFQTTEQVGYASEEVSGDNGVFLVPQYVELPFFNVSILQACSIYFSDHEYDGIASNFTVEIKQGGTTYYSKTFVGNTEFQINLDGFTVNNPDAIRITVTTWSLPRHRMRVPEIVPGVYEEWDGKMIASFTLKHQGDVSCVSLPYGMCSIRMDNLNRRFEPRNKAGIFKSIEERQGIDVSMAVRLPDGTDEYKRVGMFYQHSGGWKTGDNGMTMQWDLVDIIGLLADREFIVPTVLPTTLEGWIASLAGQLGDNFSDRYTVDSLYAQKEVSVRERADIVGMTCGEVLRYVCMVTGTWPRADAKTGYLAAEPLWNQGNQITLDNLTAYPILKANQDIAAIIFTVNDGNDTQYVVSGNSTASSNTISIDNPFIKTQSDAIFAAKAILSAYGGNQIEINGRGDPASEIGDVDTVWLDESSAITARRIKQDLSLTDGVLKNVGSTLLQADGSFLFENRDIVTQSGIWKAPSGVQQLRLILVGHGSDGTDGTDGTWEKAGTDGTDGTGAKVWSETIDINPEQEFTVSIGINTVFGQYSSGNGQIFPYGYTDIASGESFARTGVKSPIPGSGDGGAGGAGGVKGNKHTETVSGKDEDGNPTSETVTIIDNQPGDGEPGVSGVSGCAVIYWSKTLESRIGG